VRVLIGEDEALLREGLALMLERAGLQVVGAAASAPEIVRLADAEAPEIVITDIRMPPGHTDDGLRAAIELRARRPAPAVMVLSQYVQRRYALELLGDQPAGVGYLLKQRIADVERFCSDVLRVAEGQTVLDPEIVAGMLSRARRDTATLDTLTPRQMKVLALMAEGCSNAAIARRLFITEKAVVQHVSNIYAQLGLPASDDANRRVLAVMRYITGRPPSPDRAHQAYGWTRESL
jgi:DNA-binding NarL/FixJ family response regulator